MKKLLALQLLFFIIPFALFAQTKTIKGKITSDVGSPIVGATVVVKNSKIATQTDKDGNFSITVSPNSFILVSSVGFETKTLSTNNNNFLISLKNAVVTQEDVVVIGYQTVKRKDLLASVSSVGAKDLKDIPINSAAEALNGRLAGVTATTSEGSPDAQVSIRVRGGMSITGDNSPLYIVDGVQVENGLSAISPQDIQNIDVLKDAAATAIYGARGGNGVIIITTKSARVGRLRVNYNGNIGIKTLAKELKVLSPYDYVFLQSERTRGSSTDSLTFLKNFGTTWDTLNVYKNIDVVDWQHKTFGNTGLTQTHNLSLGGGTKKFTYNFGYTFNDEKAIVLNSKYQRHLFNFKTDYQVTSKIKLGVGARYTNQNIFGAGISSQAGSSYNRLRNAVKYRPYLSPGELIDTQDPLADPNVGNGLILINPILLANSEFRQQTANTFNFNANISYAITKNLSFKSTFGYDDVKSINRVFSDSITPLAIIQDGAKPVAELDTAHGVTYTNSNVFTYSIKGFRNKHDFNILVGEETYDLRSDTTWKLYGGYPTYTNPYVAFVATNTLGKSFTGYPKHRQTRYTSISFFGRISYAYKDKYLFSANIREDGSSKFGPANKWGAFPSASLAWRVSQEKFMKNVNFINDLKFRVGYGEIGNNRIPDYLYLSTFSNNGNYYYGLNGVPVIGYYSTALVNPNLIWESTVNKNLGLDFSLLKNRINVSVDVYDNQSSNLLLNVPVASTYGYSTQFQNVGKTENRGIELQLNAAIVRKKNFSWNANFNISSNKNKIVQLGVNQNYFYPSASWGVSGQPTDYIEQIGQPVGAMYGLVADGFYKVSDFDYNAATSVYTLKTGLVSDSSIIGTVMPGSIKFKDLNGDGKVDLNNDRKIIGNATPKFTGGLNQQFAYKRWDMSVFINFSYGSTIYNANKIELTNEYTSNSNLLAIMADRWKVVTPQGQTAEWLNGNTVMGIAPDQLAALNVNAKIWQPIKSAGAFTPSSWAMEDGSFLRINNVTLGYTIPANNLSKLKISRLRFYVTGNNLAIFTKYTGYDPEVSVRPSPLTQGLDYSAYPKSRTFIFGINASF